MENPTYSIVIRPCAIPKLAPFAAMLNDFVGDKIEIIRLSDTKLSTLNDALKTITNDVVIVIEERFVGLEKSFQSLADLAFSKNVIAGPRSNAIGRPNYSPVAPARFDAATLLRFCDRWGIEQDHVDTDWIDSAAFAVTKQTLETLNYLDERYSTMKFSFADFLQRASTIGVKPVVADHVYFPAASNTHETAEVSLKAMSTDWLRFNRIHRGSLIRPKVAARGPKEKPLLSVAMIVKDEMQELPQALASIAEFADEVVIYDTGSTDGTIEYARSQGAHVIEGYWDDDFARARNESVNACRGEWVMFVDADDVIFAEASALRLVLRGATKETDVFMVPCSNLEGSRSAPITSMQIWDSPRLFKRKRAMFRDRIHEQLVTRDGKNLGGLRLPSVHVLHTGYLAEIIQGRGKIERNVRIGAKDDVVTEGAIGSTEYGLGRAAQGGNDIDTALYHYARAIEFGETYTTKRLALREGIDLLVQQERLAEAHDWMDQLQALDCDPGVFTFLHGMLLLREGRAIDAVAMLEPLKVASQDGISYSLGSIHEAKAKARIAMGDRAGGADEMLKGIIADPARIGLWEGFLSLWAEQGRDWKEVAEAVSLEIVVAVFLQVKTAGSEDLGNLLQAMWSVHGADNRLLVLSLKLAHSMTVESALEWTARFREVGVHDQSPLLLLATNDEREPHDRVRASVLAFLVSGDVEAIRVLEAAASTVRSSKIGAMLDEVSQLCPDLVENFVLGVAIDPLRCEILADELAERGADDVAKAIRAHGESLATSHV